MVFNFKINLLVVAHKLNSDLQVRNGLRERERERERERGLSYLPGVLINNSFTGFL